MYRTVFLDSVEEGKGKRHRCIKQFFGLCGMMWKNGIETCILPVYFRCMTQDARGWCTGMTQRDGMGRKVGEGFRMGNTCIPVVIHVDVWQNQYNIVK